MISVRLESAAAGLIIGNIVIRPVPGARLVDVAYSDPVPARAQKIANAYAEAFIASSIDKRFEANSYAKTFLQDQAQQLKLRLEESEKALLDFSEREQIIVVNEKSSIAENNLAAANATLSTLIAERIKNEQLWKQVENANAIDLPQFLSNASISALRMQRNTLVTDYQEKLQTFKPAYPVMIEIQNKIKEIDRQLAVEMKSIKASLKGAYDASLHQEEETKKQIAQLREEVLDLQKRSIQYNSLKREVDTNRALYNGLLQKFKEVDIAGGVGTTTSSSSTKPCCQVRPRRPNLSRALLLSFALGLGAGLRCRLRPRAARRYRVVGRGVGAPRGSHHARHYPQGGGRHDRRGGHRRPALGAVRGLSLALHVVAIYHRKRPAEVARHYKRRTG